MHGAAPLPPLGTRVWLRRNQPGERLVDPRLLAGAPGAWAAFEEAETNSNGRPAQLVAEGQALRAIVGEALGVQADARTSLRVSPGHAVLLEVGKCGWMLVHSNTRMPSTE